MRHASLLRDLWLLDYPSERRDFFRPQHDFLTPTNYRVEGSFILNYYNVRYVILYKEAISGDDWPRFVGAVEEALGGKSGPYYEDHIMRVYKVPAPPANPASGPLTLDVGDGWYAAAANEQGQVYRWADNRNKRPSELYTMNLTRQPIRAELNFTLYTYKQPLTIDVAVNGYRAAQMVIGPGDGQKPVSLQITLPTGNNMVTFSTQQAPLPTDDPEKDGRLLSFGIYGLTLTPATTSSKP